MSKATVQTKRGKATSGHRGSLSNGSNEPKFIKENISFMRGKINDNGGQADFLDDAEQIAEALDGRLQANGQWLCHCPAHDDRNPSLSVGIGDNGRPVVKCFSGCSQEAVLAALTELGLWGHSGTNNNVFSAEEIAQRKAEKERERKRRQEWARRIAKQLLGLSVPLKPGFIYFLKKKIKYIPGLKEVQAEEVAKVLGYSLKQGDKMLQGRILILPIVDIDGHVQTVEFIDHFGLKVGLFGGVRAGNFWVPEKLPGSAQIVFVVEGPATALSVKMAMGGVVVSAGSCGNLIPVSKLLRNKYLNAEIIICGERGNGAKFALEAARQVGGKVVFPPQDFGDGADLNDLHYKEGLDAVFTRLKKHPQKPQNPPDETSERFFVDIVDKKPEIKKWNTPIPLGQPKPHSINPDKILPPLLTDMVKGVAKATETPIELALTYCLAVLGRCCQSTINVEVEHGYYELLCIYAICFLEPGNRKSAVQQMTCKAITNYERELAVEMEPAILEASSTREIEEKRLKHLQHKYVKGTGDNLHEAAREISELTSELTEVPTRPQLWAQDITTEKLGQVMLDNHESCAIFSAEGGFLDIITGRYSKSSAPNMGLVLQAYSGDPHRVDRGNRESVHMDSPTLSIGLSTQPGVLKLLSKHEALRDLGLWARCFLSMPKSPLGSRSLQTTPLDQSISDRWETCIKNLLSIPRQETKHTIKLSVEAWELWKSFALGVERELADGGKFQYAKDFGGKLPGQAARLAGVLHCAKHNGIAPWEHSINKETMDQALELAAIFSEHALVILDQMRTSEDERAAKKILAWIKRKLISSFSTRDCHYDLKSVFKKKSDMMPGLDLLEERGYIQKQDPIEKRKVGRPREVYEVNPLVQEGEV